MFVVLALAGGGGVLACVIAWIVIPGSPEAGAPIPARTGSRGPTSVGLVLVALGGLLLADRLLPASTWRSVGPVLLILFGGLLLAHRAIDR